MLGKSYSVRTADISFVHLDVNFIVIALQMKVVSFLIYLKIAIQEWKKRNKKNRTNAKFDIPSKLDFCSISSQRCCYDNSILNTAAPVNGLFGLAGMHELL